MSAGDGFHFGEHALEFGLQATFFSRSQFVGNNEGGEAYKSLVDLIQTSLEDRGGRRAHRIGRCMCSHYIQR